MGKKELNLTKIWVRNDDVSVCDDKYQKIIQLYKKYNVFTVLCMVPTIIEKECFDLIDGDDIFLISQHGYSHKNYKRVFNLDYSVELCDRRDINEVINQILQGKQKLESISKKPVTILTPPYNRIDEKLEKILANYYSVLSTFGDNKSSFESDFNPCIDIIDWKTRTFDKKHFERKLQEHCERKSEIGICVHHNFLSDEDIEFLDGYFNDLSNNRNVVLSRRPL